MISEVWAKSFGRRSEADVGSCCDGLNGLYCISIESEGGRDEGEYKYRIRSNMSADSCVARWGQCDALKKKGDSGGRVDSRDG
jgi:hypothetical protein